MSYELNSKIQIKSLTHWLKQNTFFGWSNLSLNRRKNAIILLSSYLLRIGHTRLTHGYLVAKEEKPMMSNSCGTELSDNRIITKYLQHVDELSSLKINNTLDAAPTA